MHLSEYFCFVGACEGSGAFEHEEEDEGDGVYVWLFAVGVAFEYFWGLVGDAHHLFSFSGHQDIFEMNSVAKISYFDLGLSGDQNVRWLKISMQNSSLMNVPIPVYDLWDVVYGFLFREGSFTFDLGGEVAFLTELGDDEDHAVPVVLRQNLYDVRFVPKFP